MYDLTSNWEKVIVWIIKRVKWKKGEDLGLRLNRDVESMGQLTKNKDMEKSVVE